jgi:hypothetical protein
MVETSMEHNALNLGIGILTGLYTFLGWMWLGRLLISGRPASRPGLRQVLVIFSALLKIGLIGVLLYLIISPAWFNLFVFVLGTFIAQIIIVSLMLIKVPKNVR